MITQLNDTVRNNVPSSAKSANALDGGKTFAATGTDTYAVTVGLGITAYVTDDVYRIRIANANTSPTVTMNITGASALGAVPVKDNAGNNLGIGDLKSGGTYDLRYDGTNLRVLNIGSGTVPDATDINKGIVELATPAEVVTGTSTTLVTTPEGIHLKNRNESAETADRALAQTDDQKVLFANKATTLTFDLPSLQENTYIIIVQVNAGAVAFTTSGGVAFENVVTPAIAAGAIGSGIALWYRTATSVLAFVGDVTNLLTSLSINGTLAVKAGASSGIIAKVGGTIFTDTTTAGNFLTGEDIAYTYTLPASVLSVNKDSLKGFVAGTFAANGNTKRIRVKFGATTLLDTGGVAFNAGSWRIDFDIIRTGVTTQKCTSSFTSSNTTLDETNTYVVAAETLSGTIVMVVTFEAVGTNDVVGEMFRLSWAPHE